MNKDPELKIPAFENRRTVLHHLVKAGYKISRAKLYRDFKRGLIRMEADGSVLEAEARNYALNNLSKIDGSLENPADIQALKNQKEVEKLDEQIAKLRFDREKEQGKYILRDEFESELAARAVVLDTGFRHKFNIKAREWIALVGGKPEKAAEFLQALNDALDEQLTSYAATRTFQVMFEDE